MKKFCLLLAATVIFSNAVYAEIPSKTVEIEGPTIIETETVPLLPGVQTPLQMLHEGATKGTDVFNQTTDNVKNKLIQTQTEIENANTRAIENAAAEKAKVDTLKNNAKEKVEEAKTNAQKDAKTVKTNLNNTKSNLNSTLINSKTQTGTMFDEIRANTYQTLDYTEQQVQGWKTIPNALKVTPAAGKNLKK